MVEHQIHKLKVSGSIPLLATMEISNIRYIGHNTTYTIHVKFDLHIEEDLYEVLYYFNKEDDRIDLPEGFPEELSESYSDIIQLIRGSVVSYNDYYLGNIPLSF